MENGISRVVVWGDSILKGILSGGDSKRFEITDENSLKLAGEALGLEIINKSVFGSSLPKTRRTQEKSLNAGITADLAIIESGGNDADYDWEAVCQRPTEAHLQRCPIDEFVRLLDEMIKTCRNYKITPLMITLPPLVTEWWFNNICIGHDENTIRNFIRGDTGILYRNQELYSNTCAEYARVNCVQLIDMRSHFLRHPDYKSLMCKDGIHPNLEGYKFMAEIWKNELPKIKKEF